MTDHDVVAKAAGLMGCSVYNKVKTPTPKHKRQYVAVVYGKTALAIMREVRPHMGARRGARIDEITAALEAGQPIPRQLHWSKRESVLP